MSPGEYFVIIIPPPQISSKKKAKKKGSATVYTQYIQQKLVACTCTRHIFTWINMHALSKQVAIQYSTDITQYPSSRQKSYSQHLHVKYTKVFKFYRMNSVRNQQF